MTATRPDRKRKGSPEWVRLGELLAARRVELDPAWFDRGTFAAARGVNQRLAQDLETNGRENFTPLTLRDTIAPAYSVTYESIMGVLEDSGDLVASPGSPPHRPPRDLSAAPASDEDGEIPGVLDMLAEPGIGPYRAQVAAERENGEWVTGNADELRIFADPRWSEIAKQALVAWRRLISDQAVRSADENAGLLRSSSAGL